VSSLQCFDAVCWRQEGHPACKSTGVVIGLERGADLHTAQLMPLPLSVSCFSKIQIGFTFLVLPAHTGNPGQRAVKRVCVCVLAHSGSPGKRSVKQVCVPPELLPIRVMSGVWEALINSHIL